MTYNDPENVPPVWQVGDEILDRYEVKQVFTGGGMGLVYRVHHCDWAMDLAVKSPRPGFFQTQKHVENFEREAETWVNLGLHQHTVSCYYVRRLGGIPRIFTEFVDGGSLAEWIRSRRLYEGGPKRAMERILDVAIQFAWGLHYAHERGLIHQDVKPGNVLVDTDGTVKVTDFGLAKARALAGETQMSSAGQSILVTSGGMTPAYCSPEQANGKPLSRKTDIWGWAISVFEMFAGQPPCRFGGQLASEAFDAYLENGGDDGHLPLVPKPLADLLHRCFRRDPTERPGTLREAAEELEVIYTSTCGYVFPRKEPKAAPQSSDALNNSAVSLLDLDRLFSKSGTWQSGAFDYFLALERKDRTHVDGMLNQILMRWRHLSKPIHEINRAIDNVLAMPGVLDAAGLQWLVSFDLETLQTRRAVQTCLRFGPAQFEHLATISTIRRQLKHDLRRFFFGLTNNFHKSATRLLSRVTGPELEITASDSHSGFVCWLGTVPDGDQWVSAVRVWNVSDGREVFHLTDTQQRIRSATLSEGGKALVVMIVDGQKECSSRRVEWSFRLGIYDLIKGSEAKMLDGMKIPPGTIRLSVNDAGTAVSVWVQPNQCADWYQVAYNYDASRGKYSRDYDPRIASPIIAGDLISASGDGERLLIASESKVQLWETSGAYLRKCLLELNLSDFGLIDNRDHLPGFDLDDGFEFTIDRWNVFDVLRELRRISGSRRVPYRIAKPQNADQLMREQAQLAQLEKQCGKHEQEEDWKAATNLIDKCMQLRCVEKEPLLEKRHRAVNAGRDRYVSRCWHHRQDDDYWDSNIMAFESEAEGEMTVKRFLRSDVTKINTGQTKTLGWGVMKVQGRDGFEPFGFTELSEARAIFLLARNTGNYEKSVALLHRNEQGDANLIWELPLPGNCLREQMYEYVVMAGDALFRRDESDSIAVHDVASGRERQRVTFDDSISVMRGVLWRGMNCASVGTKTTGKVYVLNESGVLEAEFSVASSGSACIQDISRSLSAVVFSRAADGFWHLDLQSGKKRCFWSHGETPQSPWWYAPRLLRLSACGRAVAYVFDMHLKVFDVFSGKLVLQWKVPSNEVVPPCFDLSGRWLTLAHSVNKQEIFELMWDLP
jgi:serine/threonine protein kinase